MRRAPHVDSLRDRLWALMQRQMVLEASGDDTSDVERDIARTAERLLRQGMTPIEVRAEIAEAADNAQRLHAALYANPPKRRRSSRRKGPRTGAIEVDESLFRKMARDLYGVIATGELRPRMPAWAHVMPDRARPSYRIVVGEYRVPSIRHRASAVPVKLTVRDPQRGLPPMGTTRGELRIETEIVPVANKQLRQWRRRAAEELGLSAARVVELEEEAHAAHYTGRLAYSIALAVPFEEPLDIDARMAQLRSTLRHELAHAMDESIRQRDARMIAEDNYRSYVNDLLMLLDMPLHPPADLSGTGEGAESWTSQQWAEYFNLPIEVTARLAQAVTELDHPLVRIALDHRLRTQPDEASSQIIEWSLANSPSLRAMWPRLTEANQRRVMRAVYDMVSDDIERVLEGRRTRVLPNDGGGDEIETHGW